jgi:hypothetical protein
MSNPVINTLKYELLESKNRINYPHTEERDSNSEVLESLVVDCYTQQQKKPASVCIESAMDADETKANNMIKINYNVNMDMDMDNLVSSTISQPLPRVRVKEEYRDKVQIRWCDDIGHAILHSATLKYNGNNILQSITQLTNDLFAKLFINPDDREMYNYLIGNRSYLTEWSSELPPAILSIPQHWFYSYCKAFTLRLFMCPKSKFVHSYIFNLKIANLLRFKVLDENTNTWRYERFNKKYIDTSLDSTMSTLEYPQLNGYYEKISDEAKEWILEDSKNDEGSRVKNTFHFMNLIPTKINNYGSLGQEYTHDLKRDEPTAGYIISAYNSEFRDYNIHFNYTTNYSRSIGYSPISHVTMRYKNGNIRLDSINNNQMELHTYRSVAGKAPKGVFVESFGSGRLAPHIINSTTVTSSTNPLFMIKLDNTNPYLTQDELGPTDSMVQGYNVSKGKYEINIVQLVYTRISYENGAIHVKTNPKSVMNGVTNEEITNYSSII